MGLIKKFKSMDRRQQQIWMYGGFAFIGFFILLIGILASIQIILYSIYEDKASGIRIKYPSYWTMVDHPEGGAIVAFLSPRQNSLDLFSENVNITIQPLPSPAM